MANEIILALHLFCGISIWLLTFGYVSILRIFVSVKSGMLHRKHPLPPIAVVIPTLNEEHGILGKLEDMERCDYPRDRMTVVVVDGGSEDGTVERVKEEISKGRKIKIISLPGACGKIDQVNHILKTPGPEILVFSDSDSRLEPSCIRELVQSLIDDPKNALVGASVEPKSFLLEERIHWLVLNTIWWLEGEIFAGAGISGVCYALNRRFFSHPMHDAVAEDIHIGLDAGARGYRVRICRAAKAVELRVPQTTVEFLQYRRRRGASYIHELVFPPDHPHPPRGWKLIRLLRLRQFSWVPWLGAVFGATSLFLLATRFRIYPLVFSGLFIVSACLMSRKLLRRDDGRPGAFALISGMISYAVLIIISLLSLNKHPTEQGPLGGRKEIYDKYPTA